MPLQRLALFTDTWVPQVNGVARTLDRLIAECHRRRVETLVLTPEDGSGRTDGVTRWPARPFWAYPQLHMATPSMTRARGILQAFQPDLVHVATPFGVGLSGRQAARALQIPLVSSYHTHFTAYLRHYRLQGLDAVSWPFLRWFHNGGTRTFAPTRIVADELTAHGFQGARVWGRGIDTARFSPTHRSSALRTHLGCSEDSCIVLYVGRLAPEKGIDAAMTAMRPLLTSNPDRLRFVLVGDGPAEARLRESAPAGTIFAGRREGQALSEYYASADVFLFPSTTETFGNVVLEAMASGLCVVSHNEGPTTEFAHAGTACPVDVRDAEAMTRVLREVIDAPSHRRAIADGGRTEARQRGWSVIWDQLFADYDAVLDEAGVLAQSA